MDLPASFRRRVVVRAGNSCEYCGLSQLGQAATFHVDHVVPVVARGSTVLANLALACVHCSLRKGARQMARDPKTGASIRLFDPREQAWNLHFRWVGCEMAGITATGRATIDALVFNSPNRFGPAIMRRHLTRATQWIIRLQLQLPPRPPDWCLDDAQSRGARGASMRSDPLAEWLEAEVEEVC